MALSFHLVYTPAAGRAALGLFVDTSVASHLPGWVGVGDISYAGWLGSAPLELGHSRAVSETLWVTI